MKNPLMIIGILVGVVPNVIGGAVAGPPATSFMIVNSGSGLCLEPNGSGLGEPILQQPCDYKNRPAQVWGASGATPTHHLISNRVYPRCLDVRGGVNADRTVVQQWSCDLHVPSMRWQFSTLVPDRFFKIISAIGSRCLDVAAGSLEPGAQIQIYRCTQANTNTAQIWETRAVPPRNSSERRHIAQRTVIRFNLGSPLSKQGNGERGVFPSRGGVTPMLVL